MTRNQRVTLLGAAVVILVAAFIIIRSTGGSNDKIKQTAAIVTIRNGKPVGGVKTFTWKKGQTIDLTVRSDTADEVHFHGYDVHKDVAKGGTVRFRMPATIEGRFVVELEGRKEQIASVDVVP
jgi:hypothetical protein